MVAPADLASPQLALHLEFTRGRHGAAARIELHERPQGRVGVLALRGWIDLSAARGLENTLDDLATRGVSALVVDLSELRHVDYRLVPRLVGALQRFESRCADVTLHGMSRYLRDLFRLAGFEPPSPAGVVTAAAHRPSGAPLGTAS